MKLTIHDPYDIYAWKRKSWVNKVAQVQTVGLNTPTSM